MSDPNIEILRRRLTESEGSGGEIVSAFSALEEKILLLVDTIESAHSVQLEELRQEAARLAASRAFGSEY